MTPAPKGWCPTVFRPMLSGDGWLVRVRPPAGVLRGSDVYALAAAAARDGNGTIELTNRASLQVRGLSNATVPRFAAELVGLGLGHGDPEVEQRRTIIASPLIGDDPTISRHAMAVTLDLEARLERQTSLAALPPKFGFLVDGGGVLPVASGPADIRIVLDGDRCLVSVDAADKTPVFVCAPADAAEIAISLAKAFVDRAAANATQPRRMRALIAAIGAAAVFSGVGGRPLPGSDESGGPETGDLAPLVGTNAMDRRPAPNPIGWLPYGISGRGAFGVGLPFGALNTVALQALADLSEHFGDGTLRMTPWRCLMFPGVTRPDRVSAAVTRLALIADPADPRLRIFACPGLGACSSATVATRSDARLFAGLGITSTLHVSGCPKGCARQGPVDIALVGNAGRYDVVLNGRPGDMPKWHGVAAAEVAQLLTGLEQGATA
jgi:precorrin-3B synthase